MENILHEMNAHVTAKTFNGAEKAKDTSSLFAKAVAH